MNADDVRWDTGTMSETEALAKALAALWKIRMEAKRSTVDDDPDALVQRIIHLAEGGMAGHRREAQEAAHIDGDGRG